MLKEREAQVEWEQRTLSEPATQKLLLTRVDTVWTVKSPRQGGGHKQKHRGMKQQ